VLTSTQIDIAVCRYAKKHHMFAHTVRRCTYLTFAAVKAYKLERSLTP
jgi:hypothetical protein